MIKAKIFWNGRSQAVRLPKQFRFEGNEVEISIDGEDVILHPIKKKQWPKNFWNNIRISDPGFKRPEQGLTPDRGALDST